MSLADLTTHEWEIVGECLRAVAYGPFFENVEFVALFGICRDEFRDVTDRYPYVDEFDDGPDGCDDAWLAINNAFVNLIGYPRTLENSKWGQYISADREKLSQIFGKWKR